MKTLNCSQLRSLYDSYSTKVSETLGPRMEVEPWALCSAKALGQCPAYRSSLLTAKAFASLKSKSTFAGLGPY